MAFQLSVSFKGDAELRAALAKAGRKHPEALGAALFTVGQAIKDAAVDLAPERTGYLRDSAYVAAPRFVGSAIAVELGFGADYSVWQHEQTKLHHEIGGPKFLARALAAARSTFLPEVAALTRQNVASGTGIQPATGRRNTGHAGKISAFRKAIRAKRG